MPKTATTWESNPWFSERVPVWTHCINCRSTNYPLLGTRVGAGGYKGRVKVVGAGAGACSGRPGVCFPLVGRLLSDVRVWSSFFQSRSLPAITELLIHTEGSSARCLNYVLYMAQAILYKTLVLPVRPNQSSPESHVSPPGPSPK